MAVGSGIYITWITGAILLSIAMMPIFKPPIHKSQNRGFHRYVQKILGPHDNRFLGISVEGYP